MSEDQTILGIGSRVKHPAYGGGVVIAIDVAAYKVAFMQFGIKHVGKTYAEWEIIEAVPFLEEISYTAAEKSLMKILRSWSDVSEVVEIGDKWDGGVLIMKPGDDGLKSKEIPIDTFFHKIVMIRDRVRVMEQRVNSSSKLSDEDKVNLQQYITRIYGSLTSFNVLFKYKEDYFVGDKSK